MSPIQLTTYPLDELIAYARENSLFYGKLYGHLPAKPAFPELPIVDQEEFWQAHHQDRAAVLTAPQTSGIVLNSGGTTGAPKYSYFDDQEWDSIIALSAKTFEAAGLRDGDRVANMFASGNLYASFILATESLKWTRPKVVQFPLGVAPDFAPAASIVRRFEINVLAGVPSQLLRVIYHLEEGGLDGVRIDRIIFGGESFSQDRLDYLEERFPGIQIRSASYASVDAGLIGYADAACAAGEHRAFDGAMLLEIVDEVTGEVINEVGQPGCIVFTSLIRRLMPLLRYPTGDRAQWVEPAGTADRKFLLLGRSETAARIAHCNLDVSTVGKMLEPFRKRYGIDSFQLLITRENLHDRLTFRLASDLSLEAQTTGTDEILQAFRVCRPDMAEVVQVGTMHPPLVEWVRSREMFLSGRTGKQLLVVDRRNG